jgi:RNA polymerase sigma-70 factor (ECF subfamily)
MKRPPSGSAENSGPSDSVEGESSDKITELVNRIIRGDREALAELFLIYRPRLWRMVNFRLHPRLHGRSGE